MISYASACLHWVESDDSITAMLRAQDSIEYIQRRLRHTSRSIRHKHHQCSRARRAPLWWPVWLAKVDKLRSECIETKVQLLHKSSKTGAESNSTDNGAHVCDYQTGASCARSICVCDRKPSRTPAATACWICLASALGCVM